MEEVDGEGSASAVGSDGGEQNEHSGSKQVASEHRDEDNGLLTIKEKQQSFSCRLQRSCSLDMLGDEHEFEAECRAQVLILMYSYNVM